MNHSAYKELSKLPGWAIVVLLLLAVIISVLCWNYTLGAWFGYFGRANPIPQWVIMLTPFMPGIGKLTVPAWLFTLITFSYVL